MRVVRRSRVGLILSSRAASVPSDLAKARLLPAINDHQRHVFKRINSLADRQRHVLSMFAVLPEKRAELFEPCVTVSDIVPAGVCIRRRRQRTRRTTFRWQFDSTNNPNAI